MFNSVADLEKVITRTATREMDEFLATFRRNIVGETRNKARLKNVLKEIRLEKKRKAVQRIPSGEIQKNCNNFVKS